MNKGLILETSHVEVGINAVADAFSGTVATDVINMKNFGRVRFLVHWGVGATGTSTITVEACDNVTPSNTSAIPFRYRSIVGAAAPSAITLATTAGFTTTAGSNQIIEVEVDREELGPSGYGYIRLKAVEVADDPRLGGVIVELLDADHATDTHASEVD